MKENPIWKSAAAIAVALFFYGLGDVKNLIPLPFCDKNNILQWINMASAQPLYILRIKSKEGYDLTEI